MLTFLGIDLAWREGSGTRAANETGVVLLDSQGVILVAGWTVGLDQTLAWLTAHAPRDVLLFVDAPLVVENDKGQRICERQVGERYGRWHVSANSTNLNSSRLGGVALRERLERAGWTYSDGRDGPPRVGRVVCECYPYTTIVGALELGYERERPRYKRRPKNVRTAEFRASRARECDDLIRRVAGLAKADPPVDLRSHPVTRVLVEEASPIEDRPYKHREDLLDAAICAWTAALWSKWGRERCQVLGADEPATDGRVATIIAPARPEQRADMPHNR